MNQPRVLSIHPDPPAAARSAFGEHGLLNELLSEYAALGVSETVFAGIVNEVLTERGSPLQIADIGAASPNPERPWAVVASAADKAKRGP